MPSAPEAPRSAWRIRPIGDDLLCITTNDPGASQHVARHLRAGGPWREVVAGIDSVVVQFDLGTGRRDDARRAVLQQLAGLQAAGPGTAATLVVPVCYGGDMGPDLETVCARLGLTRREFIDRHTAREYPVDMLGFTPGFAYLGGLDPSLNVPRRDEPRLRLEAGSVGIADSRTGLYSLPGPGGWSIVGRTPLRLFDADAADPFLVQPGMRVRFRAIEPVEFAAAGSAVR